MKRGEFSPEPKTINIINGRGIEMEGYPSG